MRTGLKNLGNTCFMNAALQCLLHSPEIVKLFLSIPADFNMKKCDCTALFRKLIEDSHSGKWPLISPRSLQQQIAKLFPYIADGSQHDAHEFFLLLLQALEEEQNKYFQADSSPFSSNISIIHTNRVSNRHLQEAADTWWDTYLLHNPTYISSVLYGTQLTTVRCSSCDSSSYSVSSFNTLYATIPQDLIQITINVIFEYLSMELSRTNTPQIVVHPIIITIASNALISSLSSSLLDSIDIDTHSSPRGCFIFLQGQCHGRTRVIEYTYIADDQSVKPILLTNEKTTLIAYYIPNERNQVDFRNVYFLHMMSVVTEKKSLQPSFNLINGCLPLMLVRGDGESERSMRKRVRAVLGSLFGSEREVSKMREREKTECVCIEWERVRESVFYGLRNDDDDDDDDDKEEEEEEEEEDSLPYCFFSSSLSLSSLSLSHLLLTQSLLNPLTPWSITTTPSHIISLSHLSHNPPPSPLVQEDLEPLLWSSSSSALQLLQQRIKLSLSLTHPHPARNQSFTLSDCLDFSSDTDSLEPCKHCHINTKRSIHHQITKLPPILVIVLKRFSFESSSSLFRGGCRWKLTDLIQFPVDTLCMEDWMLRDESESDDDDESDREYELMCVCNHVGGADGGHYYAYCREGKKERERWFEYNDESVKEIEKERVVRESAYLLFYRRKGEVMDIVSECEKEGSVSVREGSVSGREGSVSGREGSVREGVSVSVNVSDGSLGSTRAGTVLTPTPTTPHSYTKKKKEEDKVLRETNDYEMAIDLDETLEQEDSQRLKKKYSLLMILLAVLFLIITIIIVVCVRYLN